MNKKEYKNKELQGATTNDNGEMEYEDQRLTKDQLKRISDAFNTFEGEIKKKPDANDEEMKGIEEIISIHEKYSFASFLLSNYKGRFSKANSIKLINAIKNLGGYKSLYYAIDEFNELEEIGKLDMLVPFAGDKCNEGTVEDVIELKNLITEFIRNSKSWRAKRKLYYCLVLK
ncbi:MAG: hypothetical protein PHF99_10410 [Bacteroidales bacterium]|nr:hypothetical protein [Bacteroidales bacterium]